jgi:hypothetical protein
MGFPWELTALVITVIAVCGVGSIFILFIIWDEFKTRIKKDRR